MLSSSVTYFHLIHSHLAANELDTVFQCMLLFSDGFLNSICCLFSAAGPTRTDFTSYQLVNNQIRTTTMLKWQDQHCSDSGLEDTGALLNIGHLKGSFTLFA